MITQSYIIIYLCKKSFFLLKVSDAGIHISSQDLSNPKKNLIAEHWKRIIFCECANFYRIAYLYSKNYQRLFFRNNISQQKRGNVTYSMDGKTKKYNNNSFPGSYYKKNTSEKKRSWYIYPTEQRTI